MYSKADNTANAVTEAQIEISRKHYARKRINSKRKTHWKINTIQLDVKQQRE